MNARSMINVFDQDPYSTVSMTNSINKVPYVPGRIGELGLFNYQGIPDTSFAVEVKQGKVTLIKTSPRGSEPTAVSTPKGVIRHFPVPHLSEAIHVNADEVQGVRKFGTTDQRVSPEEKRDEKLEIAKTNIEATKELHRMGALTGKLIDTDGTVLIDFFNDFAIAEPAVIDFELDEISPVDTFRQHCAKVQRDIINALGGIAPKGFHVFCGDDFFDESIEDPEVMDAYERWADGQFKRDTHVFRQFEIHGFVFENYRNGSFLDQEGTSVDLIKANEARFTPLGVPELFEGRYAPADTNEAVNTEGLPFYAVMEPKKFNKGYEGEAQSNPIHYCTRPEALFRATIDGTPPA